MVSGIQASYIEAMSGSTSRKPAVPDGICLYAVGDIHGRADLLRQLHAAIAADAASAPDLRHTVVYLGDYVDRGLDSAAVIDLVLDAAPGGCAVIALKGNHEELMQRFLDDISVGRTWLMNGGDATLASYGVRPPGFFSSADGFAKAQADFNAKLPARHRDFLDRLPLTHVEGDYLFVHAGLRPGVPLDRQREEDLLWIRDEFLESDAGFGRIVVHGHSIASEPQIRTNRIGIDTGAFASGRLTCLVLEGANYRFLRT